MKIPMFPCKYHQNGGFSMAMLVYRRVIKQRTSSFQVIQAVTSLSPNVGGHQQPWKGLLNHPKKGHQQNCQFGKCSCHHYAHIFFSKNPSWGWMICWRNQIWIHPTSWRKTSRFMCTRSGHMNEVVFCSGREGWRKGMAMVVNDVNGWNLPKGVWIFGFRSWGFQMILSWIAQQCPTKEWWGTAQLGVFSWILWGRKRMQLYDMYRHVAKWIPEPILRLGVLLLVTVTPQIDGCGSTAIVLKGLITDGGSEMTVPTTVWMVLKPRRK